MDVASRSWLSCGTPSRRGPPACPTAPRPLGPRGLRDAPRDGPADPGARRHRRRRRGQPVAAHPADLGADERGAGPCGPTWCTDPRIYEAWGAAHARPGPRAARGRPHRHDPGPRAGGVGAGPEPGRAARDELRDRVATKFPTCAVALLSADRPWAEFDPGCAALETFTHPAGLTGHGSPAAASASSTSSREIPMQVQHGVQVGHVDRRVGGRLHDRLGVEGDPVARRREHVQVVGPVADRDRARGVDAELRRRTRAAPAPWPPGR